MPCFQSEVLLMPQTRFGRSNTVVLVALIIFAMNVTKAYAQNIPDPTQPTGWSDSYSVNGQCYCDTNFDHGLSSVTVETNDGRQTVPEICAAIRSTFGNGPQQGRLYFNTVQCGHGPVNNAADETACPGIPRASGNFTGSRCSETGATWNLDQLFLADSSPTETSSPMEAPPIELPSMEAPETEQTPVPVEAPDSEIPVLVFDICASSASDPDGDGFGFENNQSCIVDSDAGTDPTDPAGQTPAVPATAPANTPEFAICSSSDSDPDGDGFGFENNQSCIMDDDAGANPTATPGFAICSSDDSDPDGDGFGFENNQSCIVDSDAGTDPTDPEGQTPADPTPAGQTPEISAPATTPDFAICSSSDSDPDGDGFGFENNQSCIVDSDAGTDPTDPAGQTPAEPAPAVPTPEVSAPAATPEFAICSSSDSDPCLLYTSPSPRDQRGSRMPSSA